MDDERDDARDEAAEMLNTIKEVGENLGKEFKEREKRFMLHVLTNPDASGAECARQAGVPPSDARNKASEWKNDPEIQAALAELEKYRAVEITEEFITSALAKEAVTASSSRDRQTAIVNLGRTKGMFKDVIEDKRSQDTETLLDEVEKTFGKEARDRAAEELGAA